MKIYLPWVAALLGLALAAPLPGPAGTLRGQSPPPSLAPATPAPASSGSLHVVKVTVLSTMLTDRAGFGEWGFSALVEVGGKRVLFDTGGRPETVLKNARELGVDLSGVEDVILSHNHWDHTMGLVTLRRELMKTNPE